jgi:tetratricopeptide (TPR) repeat protein
MNNNINVARVLFWSIVLIIFSFAITGQLLDLSTPTFASTTDETIKINEQQTSSSEGKIRLAAAYYEKYHETDTNSYLDNGIEVLNDINGKEFPIKNYLLGIFYLEKEEEAVALKYLEYFTQNEPLHQEALLAKGAALIGLGKNQEAIDSLKYFAKIRPDIADTFELMSKAYLNLGDKKMANKVAHEAEELLGGDPDYIPGASEEKADNEIKPKN